MNQPNQHFSKSIFAKKETEQTKTQGQSNSAQEQPKSTQEQPKLAKEQPKSVQHKPTLATSSKANNSYKELKKRLHAKLLTELDMGKISEDINNESTRQQIINLVETLLQEEGVPLGSNDRKQLIEELIDDILGLGPIEPLLRDPAVNDILVNGPQKVYAERKGVLEKTDIVFDDESHLMRVITRITSGVGRRVDESSPMVDARLQDGSRVNAIILPLSIDGAALSI